MNGDDGQCIAKLAANNNKSHSYPICSELKIELFDGYLIGICGRNYGLSIFTVTLVLEYVQEFVCLFRSSPYPILERVKVLKY